MSIRIKIKEIALSPGVGPYSIQRTSDVIEPDGEVSQDLTKFTSALEEDTLDEKKTKKSKKVKADRKRQRKKAKKSAKKKKKDDRCTRIAKSKYKTWPSAYASSAVVRCRRGKIWKGLKEVLSEEEVTKTHVVPEELRKVVKEGIRIRISETLDEKKKKKKKKKKSKKKKAGTESRKEKHLGDWFDRQGGSGGEGGWVDCNTCRKNSRSNHYLA